MTANYSLEPTVDPYLGRRVLITGGGGFIGSHLAHALVARGAEIHCTALPDEAVALGARHEVDLRDRERIRAVVSEVVPHVVFHLAGVVNTSRNREMVNPTLEGNLVASVHLLETAAALEDIRIVAAGTSEEATAFTEETSPYAVSKTALLPYLHLFRQRYDLDVRLARLHMVYGPGQPGYRLVPHAIRLIAAGEEPQIKHPDRACDFVYIDDIVSGLLAAAADTVSKHDCFELGTGVATSIQDMTNLIRSIVSGAPSRAGDPDKPHVGVTADPSRFPQGWTPSITLADGLAKTVAWHAEHPFTDGGRE